MHIGRIVVILACTLAKFNIHCLLNMHGTQYIMIRTRVNRQFQLLVYACRGRWEVRYHIADNAEKIKMVAV
jgi:hypothetical protein